MRICWHGAFDDLMLNTGTKPRFLFAASAWPHFIASVSMHYTSNTCLKGFCRQSIPACFLETVVTHRNGFKVVLIKKWTQPKSGIRTGFSWHLSCASAAKKERKRTKQLKPFWQHFQFHWARWAAGCRNPAQTRCFRRVSRKTNEWMNNTTFPISLGPLSRRLLQSSLCWNGNFSMSPQCGIFFYWSFLKR